MRIPNEAMDLWQAYRAGSIGPRDLLLFSRRLPCGEVELLRGLLCQHGRDDVAVLLPSQRPAARPGLNGVAAPGGVRRALVS